MILIHYCLHNTFLFGISCFAGKGSYVLSLANAMIDFVAACLDGRSLRRTEAQIRAAPPQGNLLRAHAANLGWVRCGLKAAVRCGVHR